MTYLRRLSELEREYPSSRFIRLRGKVERYAIVDLNDFEHLASDRWYFAGRRYAARHVYNGPRYRAEYMHRVILGAPAGTEVDHINGDGLDNRRCNLRLCTTSQNQFNRPPPSNNTSGVKGVSYVSARKRAAKWYAQIEVNGRAINLGWYRTRQEAIEARVAAEQEHCGAFMHETSLTQLRNLELAWDGPIPKRLLDGLRTPEERRRHMIQRAQRWIAECQLVLDEMQLGVRRVVGNDRELYTRERDAAIALLHRLEDENAR